MNRDFVELDNMELLDIDAGSGWGVASGVFGAIAGAASIAAGDYIGGAVGLAYGIDTIKRNW